MPDSMILPVFSLFFGLVVLVWSADRFVDGSVACSSRLGVSPLLIGMIVVGFGTSAPEMVVSVLASFQGNSGIALGNAYGSNIANIALILGVSAVICPIYVNRGVVRRELPVLSVATFLAVSQLFDGSISRFDGMILLFLFALIMTWTIVTSPKIVQPPLSTEPSEKDKGKVFPGSLFKDMLELVGGLILLVVSSRALVWGAVSIAKALGVSDLIVGLTIVAVGTSLPELASSISACRKGHHEVALGNVLGSNLFNTLAVVGVAALVSPLEVEREVLYRDSAVMIFLTLSLFAVCHGFRGVPGKINRAEGLLFLVAFALYTGWLVISVWG